MRQRENLGALLWSLSCCVWIFAAIPIKKRLIQDRPCTNAGTYTLLAVFYYFVSYRFVVQLEAPIVATT